MNNYTRLFIDSQEVDLQELEDLPLTFSLRITSDFENNRVSGGDSKKNIELPPTKRNLQLFEQWYKNYIDSETAVQLKPFYIQVNGVQVLSGLAQLQKFTGGWMPYGRGAKSIKVALFSNNADWIKKVSTLQLKDLDWSDTDRLFNSTNVTLGWNASQLAGDKVAFPLIKYKEWHTPGEVDYSEFTPALFIRDILDKILASAGYTIVSSFLDSALFRSLILLVPVGDRYNEKFSEDFLNIQADLQTPIVITPSGSEINMLQLAFDNVIDDTSPPSPYNPLTGEYTVPYDGFYDIDFSAVITDLQGGPVPPAEIIAMGIDVQVNGVFVTGGPEFNESNIGIPDIPKEIKGTRVVEAEAGDIITIQIIVANDAQTTSYTIGEGALKIVGEAKAGFGAPLIFEYLLEDWSASDLIKGVQDIYNLRFETDVDRQTVTIEPAYSYLYTERLPAQVNEIREGFYRSTFNDLSQKVDLIKDSRIISRNNTKRNQFYGYELEGETEEFIQLGQPLSLYSTQYDLGPNRFDEDTEKRINPFFAATIHTYDTEITETNFLPVQIPLIYAQNYIEDPTATQADFNITPRILHFFGQRGTMSRINVTLAGLVDPPECFFINYQDTTGLDPSLSFATQTVSDNALCIGALQRYFIWELVRFKKGKDIEEFIFWNANDIIDITFRDTVLIEDAEFILQEINGYNPLETGSIKTILSYIFAPSQSDVDQIENAQTRGLANLT